MAMKWSLSRHRMFRRCQRQYYFAHIAAWHKTNDPIRKEAFILKQVRELPAWQGLVIHQGIRNFVIPTLQRALPIEWNKIAEQTVDLAQKQFHFSKIRTYRTNGITKSGTNGEYCALAPHERGEEILYETLCEVADNINHCFTNLSQMNVLIKHIQGRSYYQAEKPITAQFNDIPVEIVPDLVISRRYGCPTILDWKVEKDSTGGDNRLQTDLYAWVLCQNPKWGIRRPEDIEMFEIQLLQGRAKRSTFSSERFEEIEDFIYQSAYEIWALCGSHKYEEQLLANYQYALSPNTCAYCSFNSLCKELRL